MKTTVAISLIIGLMLEGDRKASARQEVDLIYRVAIGSEKTPIPSGIVWLYGSAWGNLEKFELGTIKNGLVRIRLSERILQSKQPSSPTEAYVVVLELFKGRWYRTADIEPERLLDDFSKVLNTLGMAKVCPSGETLMVLPPLSKRRITFQSEDGKPVAGLEVRVSIYLHDRNHCGFHTGLPLGRFRTNAKGEIGVIAPLVPLYLDELEYYQRIEENELGPEYEAMIGLKIGTEPSVLVRKVWELPERKFELRVQRADGTRLAGVLISQKLRSYECGVWSGIIGHTDARGIARVQFAPEETELLTLVTKDRKMRELSDEELKELFAKGRITLKW
jgi:hypothetical protein